MALNQQPLSPQTPDRVRAILEEISLLGGLDNTQLECLLNELQTVFYQKGEVIFEQDSPPSFIYIILSGKVKTFYRYQDTALQMLVMERGQCFGVTSVIGIQPHSVTAVALEDCELLLISPEALNNLFDKDKALYSMLVLNIARETSRNLYNFRERFIEYAMSHQAKSS